MLSVVHINNCKCGIDFKAFFQLVWGWNSLMPIEPVSWVKVPFFFPIM